MESRPPLPRTDEASPAAALDRAAAADAALAVRYACLLLPAALAAADRGALAAAVSARLRAPTDCRELAALLAREFAALRSTAAMDAAAVVALLERCDALRRPARFEQLLQACACFGEVADTRLRHCLQAAAAVDTAQAAAAAAAQGARGPAVGAAVSAARADAVAAALAATSAP